MRILVGTEEGLVELGAPRPPHLAGHAITALAGDGPRLWVLVDGRTVWRADTTEAWAPVVEVPGVEATCLLPTPEGVLVGTAGARLLRLAGGALAPIAAFEAVEGRAAWFTPWGDPPDTRSLARDAAGALFVNVHVGGVVRSTDGGRRWQPTLDIETDVHQVLADPRVPGRVLAAAAVGFVVSDDGGATWRTETDGLHARYGRAVALVEGAVLLAVSTGPGGRRAALYRRETAGATFERCRAGLPEWFGDNVDTHCLAGAGTTAALGTGDGRVFRSDDAGRSWTLAAKGLAPVTCVVLA